MSWNPTHVVVAVQRAKDLISKGKNGTNDAFVTIALNDNKFQTSIKDKAIDPEWYEECDVPLPEDYNKHKLILQIFHRNNLGIDEFLGYLEIILQNVDVYDAPRSVWHPLLCKPGQNKTKPRGEIEVRLSFEVKKAKDLDSLSVTSAASKRFKMSKKSIKHAASALGRKIKGPKVEKTADYVPDLNALDTGALSLDDIAENYSAVASRKRLSGSDSMSLPPASPGMVRSSPRSSKGRSGYSPFDKRRSRGDLDTPPSSNASTEDVRPSADDADSSEGFVRGHRRGGSGSDVSSSKPNRRLLTSKPRSSSNVDISSTPNAEVSTISEKGSSAMEESIGKSRIRNSASTSQIGEDVLPEVNEDSSSEVVEESKPHSSAAAIPAEPILIDDDSDGSVDNYKPSPVVPLLRNPEPAGLFERLDEQMEEEQANLFKLVAHQAEPGEDIYTPVGKISESLPAGGAAADEVDQLGSLGVQADNKELDITVGDENKEPSIDVIAHSTPKLDEFKEDVSFKRKAKHRKSKGKKKVAPPSSDLFNLLMDSNEPEYNVDATLSYKDRKNMPSFDIDPSAGGNVDDVNMEPVDPVSNQSKMDSPPKHSASELLNLGVDADPSTGVLEPHLHKSINNSSPAGNGTNPFEEPSSATNNSNPFDEPSPSANSNNPFNDPSPTANPFGEPSPAANVSNPFEEPSVDMNKSNPFEVITAEADLSPNTNNPFEETSSKINVSNPFKEVNSTSDKVEKRRSSTAKTPSEQIDSSAGGLNPFEDDEDTEFKRVGSFARAGSNRFKNSARQKKREKTAAPPPPKPQRLFTESSTEVNTDAVVTPSDNSSENLQMSSDSPRQKSKKEKKAPQAPNISLNAKSPDERVRSSSQNSVPSQPMPKSHRKSTDISDIEKIANANARSHHAKILNSPSTNSGPGKFERQPAIGAEAPEVPVEKRVTREASTQATMDEPESVPAEFVNMSKMDLVEMIQRLRLQVRKKEEHSKDLEEYIDSLLLRVMSNDPNLLSAQSSCSQQANQANKLR